MKRDGKQLKTSGSLPEQSIQNLFLFLLKNLSVQIKCSLQKMACHNYSTELIEPRANVQSWALFKSYMPNLYPHPTNKVGRLYPEFFPSFNFVLGGGRENCKILFKGCTVLWGQPEITQNNKNYIIVPRTFALDCSLSLTSKIPAPNFGEISDCASGKPRDKWSELTKIAALNLPQCSQTQQLIQFLTLLPTKKLLFVTFMQLSLSYLRIEREQNK